jgi:hypothetical protein
VQASQREREAAQMAAWIQQRTELEAQVLHGETIKARTAAQDICT